MIDVLGGFLGISYVEASGVGGVGVFVIFAYFFLFLFCFREKGLTKR